MYSIECSTLFSLENKYFGECVLFFLEFIENQIYSYASITTISINIRSVEFNMVS